MFRQELHQLIRQFETHLEWAARQGRTGVSRARSGAAEPEGAPGRLTLPLVRAELGECTRCKLHRARTNIVFGVGNPAAHLLFVGEAPGYDEDRQGEPFVGAAGQLLDKMIAAMGLSRTDVYIAN